MCLYLTQYFFIFFFSVILKRVTSDAGRRAIRSALFAFKILQVKFVVFVSSFISQTLGRSMGSDSRFCFVPTAVCNIR